MHLLHLRAELSTYGVAPWLRQPSVTELGLYMRGIGTISSRIKL